jgi:hypothetical protein
MDDDLPSPPTRETPRPDQDLALSLKSVIPDASQGVEPKCLVKFHNCTNKDVTLYWIDFSGEPREFFNLGRRQSITVDTFVRHMWFFRTDLDSQVGGGSSNGPRQANKVLAVRQEALVSSCNATNYNYRPLREDENQSERLWICPLCRHVVRRYFRRPIKNPCHHYSGEARISSSDLGIKSHSNYNSIGEFIYSCTDSTHHESHSRTRRDIYLVESFYNLRERCFLRLHQRTQGSRAASLNLPKSVLNDYIQFANAFDKCSSI